jgi:hypothetical protein
MELCGFENIRGTERQYGYLSRPSGIGVTQCLSLE